MKNINSVSSCLRVEKNNPIRRFKARHITLFLFIASATLLTSAQTSISTPAELAVIANNKAGAYQLAGDITLTTPWTPIGTTAEPFTGTLDGNGYTIYGLDIDNPTADYQALFSVTDGATIKNLAISGAAIVGRDYVGAIAAHQQGGSIQQCYVTNSRIQGRNATGTLAGQISRSAHIQNTYAAATVAVQTQTQGGGLVGIIHSGTISKSYFAGTVTATEARANGIGALVEAGDEATAAIEYTVNLSPQLIVSSGRAYPYTTSKGYPEHVRIVDPNGQPIALTRNYSLHETRLGKDEQTAAPLPSKDTRVMSFNIPYFSDSESNQIKRWNYRKEAIIAMIKQEQPLILGMQEIRYDPQLIYLDSELDQYARIGVGRDDGANGGDFSVIYYRKDIFELINTGDFWLSETPGRPSYGWGAGHRRITTWGHFRLKDTDVELLVYNTHFDHAVQKAKEESARMMADSIASRLAPNVQIVIATGDYNTSTNQALFQPFWKVVSSVRDDAPVTNHQLTTNSWGSYSDGEYIDHVLYRNCVPRTFNVLTQKYNGIQYLSDHFPVLAELDMPLDTQYGATRPHGESIIQVADARTKTFYSHKLQWDFVDTWTIDEGNAYPTLKVFHKTASYEIATAEQLKAIAVDLSATYTLTADITLTGQWTPLGTEAAPFTGVFDGNGKTITGLTYTSTATNKAAFFAVTDGATIKNLGIEHAAINGDTDVAAIVGQMKGGLMQQCYVVNSRIEGRDHVASLVGKLSAGAIIQDCYSSSEVTSRAIQAGGLCGIIIDNGTKITRSYFSGKVSTPTDKQRSAAIVALVDNQASVSIERCLNLAATIGGGLNMRIAHYGNYGGSTYLIDNYSLSTTPVHANGTTVEPTDANYGATRMHGANLPADADAFTAAFYQNTLGWDFNNTWKFMPRGGYPVFTWQTGDVGLTIFSHQQDAAMIRSSTFDLSSLIRMNNAPNTLRFTTTTPGASIAGTLLTISSDPSVEAPQTVAVNIAAQPGFHLPDGAPATLNITVLPDEIQIRTPADFSKIEQYPFANFVLAGDLDLAGITFNGLCSEDSPFTGTFDGRGHTISHMAINRSEARGAGFFNATKGATIRNVGFENAAVKLTTDHKSAGIIIGLMRGGLLEQSYTAHSTVEGYDHVGSVVGSIEAFNEKAGDGAIVRNCYGADNKVTSRNHQAGGFAGTIMKATVENSYFSGIVRSKNRAVGLISYIDNTGHAATDVVVQNCASLATEIQSTGFKQAALYRIIDNNGNRPMTLRNNYALRTTNLSGSDIQTGTATTEVKLTERNGFDVPEINTKTAAFYIDRLKWDFKNIWQIEEGEGYPTLRAFNKTETSVAPPHAGEEQRNMVNVYAVGNTLHINGLIPAASAVNIHTITGRQIAALQPATARLQYTLPHAGIYIITVDRQGRREAYKIVVY